MLSVNIQVSKMVEISNWGLIDSFWLNEETEGKLKFKLCLSNFLQFLITKHLLGDLLKMPCTYCPTLDLGFVFQSLL